MKTKDPQGNRVPDLELKLVRDGRIEELSTVEIFSKRTVIVFGLPGAFTPTCSNAHVPRFNELASTFKKHGVDEILCVSVNDVFVMSAWKREQEADKLTFVADGNGDFSRGLGFLVDRSDVGFGERSWRYSMLVRDGVVEKTFIEPDVPGDPFEVSDADTMLHHIAPEAKLPHDVLLLTRPGCRHCERARLALQEAGMEWEEVPANLRVLRAVSSTPTTPRVFVDGSLLGGADDLIDWLGLESAE